MKNINFKPIQYRLVFYVGIILTVFVILSGSNPVTGQSNPTEDNPLLKPYNTPFNVPPFEKIKDEHFLPAFKEAFLQQKKEVDAIVDNPETPTFANTIEALNSKGKLMNEVYGVFNVYVSSNTNEQLQKINAEVSQMRSMEEDSIVLNEKLFRKVKAVYDMKNSLKLSEEQQRLLEHFYKDFTRKGANLDPASKERLKQINVELASLSVKYDNNVLKENNTFKMVLHKKEDLEGLPESLVGQAAAAAKRLNMDGKWVFTLHRPSIFPFLQYSARRDLREKIFKAYINKGNNGDDADNKAIVLKIVSLKAERAKLLGYENHAAYTLDNNMAKNASNVYNFLGKLWTPARETAKNEVKELQSMIDKEGGKFKLEPWDWWYYAEKLKKAKFSMDDEIIKPYFKLENVRDGAFYVANKLYGIKLVERKDITKYQPDVQVFEVLEADGRHIGIMYMDFFVKPSKRSGAWAGAIRKEYYENGKRVPPIVTNNHNLNPPVGDKPALLNFDEVKTIFHEFGHGLHNLLSNCNYWILSGSAVSRDFVELPSQIMENWATEPEVLKVYAKHYKTGEVIPKELLEKIKSAELFNIGFDTVEVLAASYLDMDWHCVSQPVPTDVEKFEKASLTRINLIPEIESRYRSTYFTHIFSGGYAAGYYSYLWAEVLDADAYAAFKEKNNIFDQDTAKSFRTNILEKGYSADLMTLYRRFRGTDPGIEPLLKRKGFIK